MADGERSEAARPESVGSESARSESARSEGPGSEGPGSEGPGPENQPVDPRPARRRHAAHSDRRRPRTGPGRPERRAARATPLRWGVRIVVFAVLVAAVVVGLRAIPPAPRPVEGPAVVTTAP